MRIADMAALEQVVKGCTACGLRAGCRGVVFGDGNPSARLMLIGEGPGADEDRLGRPFVGRAGQLLDRILAACGFDRRRHVYIANIVKCRPPGNRTPTPEERAACLPNLQAQMRLVRPAIVVLLGATALQALIDPGARITRARGQWIYRDGIWYMPTYHPAALLRNPGLKRDCWHDFKKVIDKYRELVDPAHVAPHHPPVAAGEPGAAAVSSRDGDSGSGGEEPWAAVEPSRPCPPGEPARAAGVAGCGAVAVAGATGARTRQEARAGTGDEASVPAELGGTSGRAAGAGPGSTQETLAGSGRGPAGEAAASTEPAGAGEGIQLTLFEAAGGEEGSP